MKVFAISDTHLSLSTNKPMDIFGENWADHAEKIRRNWLETVGEDDIVALSGDISWALKLSDARLDLDWLRELPGQKVFLRGNHDYWWSSLKKISEIAGEGMHFVQNNCVTIKGISFAGSRLWDFPYIKWPIPPEAMRDQPSKTSNTIKDTKREDDEEKIRTREINRLKNSLQCFPEDSLMRICLTHFPPVSLLPESNDLTEIISGYKTDICVYGHIHSFANGEEIKAADCVIGGVRYVLTSCDWLDFCPKVLAEL